MDPSLGARVTSENPPAPSQAALLRRAWSEVATTAAPELADLPGLLDERLTQLESTGTMDEPTLLAVAEESSHYAMEHGAADVARTLSKRLRRAIYEFLLALDAVNPAEVEHAPAISGHAGSRDTPAFGPSDVSGADDAVAPAPPAPLWEQAAPPAPVRQVYRVATRDVATLGNGSGHADEHAADEAVDAVLGDDAARGEVDDVSAGAAAGFAVEDTGGVGGEVPGRPGTSAEAGDAASAGHAEAAAVEGAHLAAEEAAAEPVEPTGEALPDSSVAGSLDDIDAAPISAEAPDVELPTPEQSWAPAAEMPPAAAAPGPVNGHGTKHAAPTGLFRVPRQFRRVPSNVAGEPESPTEPSGDAAETAPLDASSHAAAENVAQAAPAADDDVVAGDHIGVVQPPSAWFAAPEVSTPLSSSPDDDLAGVPSVPWPLDVPVTARQPEPDFDDDMGVPFSLFAPEDPTASAHGVAQGDAAEQTTPDAFGPADGAAENVQTGADSGIGDAFAGDNAEAPHEAGDAASSGEAAGSEPSAADAAFVDASSGETTETPPDAVASAEGFLGGTAGTAPDAANVAATVDGLVGAVPGTTPDAADATMADAFETADTAPEAATSPESLSAEAQGPTPDAADASSPEAATSGEAAGDPPSAADAALGADAFTGDAPSNADALSATTGPAPDAPGEPLHTEPNTADPFYLSDPGQLGAAARSDHEPQGAPAWPQHGDSTLNGHPSPAEFGAGPQAASPSPDYPDSLTPPGFADPDEPLPRPPALVEQPLFPSPSEVHHDPRAGSPWPQPPSSPTPFPIAPLEGFHLTDADAFDTAEPPAPAAPAGDPFAAVPPAAGTPPHLGTPPAAADPTHGEHGPDDDHWRVRQSPRAQLLAERMAQKRREEAARAAFEAASVFDEPDRNRKRRRGDEPPLDLPTARRQIDEYLRKKRGAEAGALLQRLAQGMGGREIADLALDAGDRCRALGQSRSATNCYLAAWRADPLYETPLWRLSDICLNDQEIDLAVGYLERIAELMRSRGDDEGAIGVYRKIAMIAPERQDVRDVIRLAKTTGRLDG